MAQQVYIDGEYFDKDDAKISVFDHGLLYGDGVFEGIRAYNGRVFKLDTHVERLFESAKAILLDIPVSFDEMKKIVTETCLKNDIRDGYIRLIVTRGEGDLGMNPFLCPKATVICIAATIQLYPQEFYENGLTIVTVPTTRNYHDAINPRIKSLNYLNNVMAKIEAIQSGVPEAIMLNTQGFVAECTGDNLFLIKKGKLITPCIASGALEGITRNVVIELAKERGLEIVEDFVTRFEVYNAEECFLTGTAAEVIPVIKVDSREIGNGAVGEMTKTLISDFKSYAKDEGEIIPFK